MGSKDEIIKRACDEAQVTDHWADRLAIGFIDVETTGLTKRDEVVEFASLVVQAGTVINEYQTLVRPRKATMSDEATQLTGIRDEDLIGAPTPEEIGPWVQVVLNQADVLVAYNAEFDRRYLHKLVGGGLDLPWVDAMEWAHATIPTETMRLEDKLAAVGVTQEGAHRAMDDAHALSLLWPHLVKHMPPFLDATVALEREMRSIRESKRK